MLGEPLGQLSNSEFGVLGLDVGSVLKGIEHESRPSVSVCVWSVSESVGVYVCIWVIIIFYVHMN